MADTMLPKKGPAREASPFPGALSLPRLPWTVGALAPVISSRTVQYHYSLHHANYVETANRLLLEHPGPAARSELDVLRWSADQAPGSELFHNVSQAWNHGLFWRSLTPGKERPGGPLRAAIEREFGDYARFAHAFAQAGMHHFGSGWLWLAADASGRLRIQAGLDDANPALRGQPCLLAIDLWEHAYYLDHHGRRREYLDAIIDRRLNWQAAQKAFNNFAPM